MNQKVHIFKRIPQVPDLVPLDMPDWGENLHILKWNAGQRDAFSAEQTELNKAGKGLVNFRARLVAACVVHGDATPVFDAEEDLEQLGKLPHDEIERVYQQCSKTNLPDANAESDAAKNS